MFDKKSSITHSHPITLITFLFVLSGCTTSSMRPAHTELGIDNVACLGTVTEQPPELHEITLPALQKRAQFISGKGGVCSAKVFSVITPIPIYRIYDASQADSKFGGWWTFKRPSGTKEAYRADNAICEEWSRLDRMLSCKLKAGATIVIGTTQSAMCNNGLILPKTIENQIFIPNDITTGTIYVDSCQEEKIWH